MKPWRIPGWAAAAAIAAAGGAAYATSFRGVFQFDDIPAILDNPTIRWIWPPTIALYPPVGALTVSGRPLLNLSFAVNYALSGFHPWSYHALNLLIHLACALVLFGLVRRTLARGAEPAAEGCALAAALLWAVHPVTTECVTYIVQRAESLAALCYLGTLYGLARGADSGRRRWLALSAGACLFGCGVKETIATAPLAAYLYDRTFLARSWAGPWRERKGYYLALAATWLPLLGLVAWIGWDRGATSGFHVGVPWWPYWRSQGEALARYASLAFWPHPLAFDYGRSSVGAFPATALFALLVAALAATAAGAWRGRAWAFPIAASFLVLAPTSVIPGVLQFVAEHRDYLPLAAAMTLLAVGAARAARALGAPGVVPAALLLAAAAALGALTARRSLDYRTELGLWLDTVAKRPGDALAQANVGHALLGQGKVREALPYCLRSIELDPTKPQPHYNLGLAYEELQRWNPALEQFEIAAAINPELFYADFRAGRILDRLGHPAEAERWLRRALAIEPNYADTHGSLGVALAALGRPEQAIEEYRRSLALRPDQPEVEFNLGVVLAARGRIREAIERYAAAVRLDPKYAAAELNLGLCLGQVGRWPEAEQALRAAVRIEPESPEAHGGLALLLDQMGRPLDAVAEFQEALKLRPDFPEARYNYGNALLRLGEAGAARDQFAEAVRLRPDFAAAREMLERTAGPGR